MNKLSISNLLFSTKRKKLLQPGVMYQVSDGYTHIEHKMHHSEFGVYSLSVEKNKVSA
jgi:hypothetical protein